MTVRSNRLAIGLADGSTISTVYTTPTGYRTIIKMISCQNVASVFNRLYVEMYQGSTVEGYLMFPLGANGGLDEAKHVPMFQVLPAGHSLKIDALHNGILYVISGAELQM